MVVTFAGTAVGVSIGGERQLSGIIWCWLLLFDVDLKNSKNSRRWSNLFACLILFIWAPSCKIRGFESFSAQLQGDPIFMPNLNDLYFDPSALVLLQFFSEKCTMPGLSKLDLGSGFCNKSIHLNEIKVINQVDNWDIGSCLSLRSLQDPRARSSARWNSTKRERGGFQVTSAETSRITFGYCHFTGVLLSDLFFQRALPISLPFQSKSKMFFFVVGTEIVLWKKGERLRMAKLKPRKKLSNLEDQKTSTSSFSILSRSDRRKSINP